MKGLLLPYQTVDVICQVLGRFVFSVAECVYSAEEETVAQGNPLDGVGRIEAQKTFVFTKLFNFKVF